MPTPLDSTDVLRIAEGLYNSSTFQDWKNANDLRHDLVYRDTPVDIPGISQLMEARGSEGEVHGSRFIDRLVAAQRKIQVAALKDTEPAQRRAQDAENFFYSLFADWDGGGQYNIDPARTLAIGSMTYYGMYALRLDFCKRIRQELNSTKDQDDLEEQLDKILEGLNINPWELVWPHWATLTNEPDYSVVCEKGEVKLSELAKLANAEDLEDLRNLVSSSGMAEYDSVYDRTVPYVHMEDGDYIYDVVGTVGDNKALQIRPNPIGRPWYVFASGKLSPETAPMERYRPLLAPIYPLLEERNRLRTLLNSAALQEGRTGYQLVANNKQGAPDIYSWMAQPANERPVLAFGLSSDALVNPPAGYHYENMPIPDRQILIQAYQETRRDIENYGFPAPLSPDQALTGQASSGHLATREIEQANFSINPALTRIAGADKECCKLVGDIITKLELTVSIPVFKKATGSRVREVVTVDKRNFQDIDIALDLDGSTASMDYAAKESDNQALQLGTLSKESFMQKWREDPVAEMRRLRQEKIAIPMEEMISQSVLAFVQQTMQQRINNAAAKRGIAIPPPTPPAPVQTDGVVPPAGGPEESGGSRNMRPPDPMPGLGAPPNPEVQSIAAEGLPVG